MVAAILQWLGGNDTGSSSKTIALTALGEKPNGAETRYPSDGADFGRCYRLLALCPGAQAGLDVLGRDGGPYWAALVSRWADIQKAYLAEIADPGRGKSETYKLMRSILDPVEATDPRIVRIGQHMSIRY